MSPSESSFQPSAPKSDLDQGPRSGSLEPKDFWEVLYGRRSIRRFKPDAVARELTDKVMHAGIWAPSSCNYQMWDVVAVDDPQLNAQLAGLSTQLGNAPTNLVVSYGREFSEEGWANIQSASAMIQNMSLAAHALGLGTFWITQMGDREALRETLGLPADRLVIAVLALGYPQQEFKQAPGRRPLERVTHYNRYTGRAIPSSSDPADWDHELLKVYQRARVLNGLRHNKPRVWEVRALDQMLARFVEQGVLKPADEQPFQRWLDVLPCNGIVCEHLSRARKGFHFDVLERSAEVARFAAHRTRPRAGILAWPEAAERDGFGAPEEGDYDVLSCLFRLEGLTAQARAELMGDMQRWLKPGGQLIVGFVSRKSFHPITESLRRRRAGPRGVEYVLSPEPNIGPFEALLPGEVTRGLRDAGLVIEDRFGVQALPQPEEVAFRTRNFGPTKRRLVELAANALGFAAKWPGLERRRGRFQFISARKPL